MNVMTTVSGLTTAANQRDKTVNKRTDIFAMLEGKRVIKIDRLQRILDIILEVEWVGLDLLCPYCNGKKGYDDTGHSEDCELEIMKYWCLDNLNDE